MQRKKDENPKGKSEIPMFLIRGGWSRSSAEILGNGEGAKGFT